MIAACVVVLVVVAGAGARAAWVASPSAAARARLGRDAALMAAERRAGSVAPAWILRRAAVAGVRPEALDRVWPIAPVLAVSGLIGATVLFRTGGFVVAGAVVVASPVVMLRILAGRDARRRARALPLLLEDVARGLRSGASLRQALLYSVDRADATLQSELRIVCSTMSNGGSIASALETWRERQPAEGLGLAVAALTLGLDAGGAQGRALDAVAASLRDRLAVQREVAALSSQARASAGVMAVAPVLFAAFTVTADPRSAHFLLGTAAGLTCLISGLVLDAMAGWWMWRLTGVDP